MTTIASICARGGSTGLPRKNVKPLMGRPLIVHTIEQAKACSAIERIFVSTDSKEIDSTYTHSLSSGMVLSSARFSEIAKQESAYDLASGIRLYRSYLR